MSDKLTSNQIQALRKLSELGSNPYRWYASQIGFSGKTLKALEDRGLVHGGNVYGCRTRSYIMHDRGSQALSALSTAE